MDFKQIKELINLINDSSIGEIKIVDKEFEISIRHQNYQKKVSVAESSVPIASVSEHTSGNITSVSNPKSAETEEDDLESEDLITVKSPMIGTFYRASSPDKPPFIKVGDHINKDDVLCIIEAMKLFNEIESEVKGRIVKVLVENEAPIEYDQPLFLVDPNG